MSTFVPEGYITVRDALNRLGHQLFPSEWTGEEHKARAGLLGQEEWLKVKDFGGPTGGGAPGGGAAVNRARQSPTASIAHWTGDPSDPSYQAEYRANMRYAAAKRELRVQLEAGRLEAALLDSWTGKMHRAPTSMWRRHDADRMIAKEKAPIPSSRNTGTLMLRLFGQPNPPRRSMPEATIRKAIELLREKRATETMTRSQQAELVRKTFPNFHVTARQMRQIFEAVPTRIGRPRKPDNKV